MTNRHYSENIPSFQEAERAAQLGDVYCWLCCSYEFKKKGARLNADRFEFHCDFCGQYFTYKMSKVAYTSLVDGRTRKAKNKNKSKVKPQEKLLTIAT